MKLTDEQVKKIVSYATEKGRERARAQGADFGEADYLCGVMSVFFALENQGNIPAKWIFGTMAGDPVLRETPDTRPSRARLLTQVAEARYALRRVNDVLQTEGVHGGQTPPGYEALCDEVAFLVRRWDAEEEKE